MAKKKAAWALSECMGTDSAEYCKLINEWMWSKSGISCLAEVDLSPKPFSNPTWSVTLFKGPMNDIMGDESH